jgi:hypothetical protein
MAAHFLGPAFGPRGHKSEESLFIHLDYTQTTCHSEDEQPDFRAYLLAPRGNRAQ